MPNFNPGDVVYFRESAALGFVEAVRISGVHLTSRGWLYTVSLHSQIPFVGMYNDRRSLINNETVFYSESELVSGREAYELAEAAALRNYERIRSQRESLFPNDVTAG